LAPRHRRRKKKFLNLDWRSSSYRVPKTISFGFGVPKVFPTQGKKSDGGKHWHQGHGKHSATAATKIEHANFDDMRMALE
jgi:hypothetical protein